MDGKCGSKNGNLKCGGRWGDCCSLDGKCGTGKEFCVDKTCQSGNCDSRKELDALLEKGSLVPLPWLMGTTANGTCGGPSGLTCSVVFGECCNKDGQCGSRSADCGVGWYVRTTTVRTTLTTCIIYLVKQSMVGVKRDAVERRRTEDAALKMARRVKGQLSASAAASPATAEILHSTADQAVRGYSGAVLPTFPLMVNVAALTNTPV
jgi:hypothetical protein